MSVKEYLAQVFTIDRLLKARLCQIDDMRDRAEAITSRLSLAPGGKGRSDGFSDYVVKYLALLDGYIDDVMRLYALKAEVEALIGGLKNPVHRLIMTERYVNLKRWEDVAVDNNYSWRAVHKFHGEALRTLEKMPLWKNVH